MPILDSFTPYQYKTSFTVSDLIPITNNDVLFDDDRYVGYRIPETLTAGKKICGVRSIDQSVESPLPIDIEVGRTTETFRTYFYQPNTLWIIKPYGLNKGLRLTAAFLLENDI